MERIWRWIFGLEAGEAPAGDASSWELSGLPHGLWIWVAGIVAAAAVALVVLLYRRESTLSRGRRILLATLRLGGLAVVVWMLLDPRLLTEIRLERPGHLLVLVDTSASMGRSDVYEGAERDRVERASGLDPDERPSRLDLLLASFRRGDVLSRLSERHRLALYTFDDGLRPWEGLEGGDRLRAEGDGSRIGDAVREAVQDAGSAPLAGVLLLTDGRRTGGESLAAVGRELVGRGRVPIWAVGVGRMDEPPNRAIVELVAPPAAETGSPVEIEASVAIRGIRDPAEVVLFRTSPEERRRVVVERRTIEPRGWDFSARLRWVDTPPGAGTYHYRVEIARHVAEDRSSDNRRAVTVRVVEQSRRVLLVGGEAVREYCFLRNLILRDPRIVASTWLAAADDGVVQDGDVVIDGLPSSPDAILEYDVVVLIDPDPDSLDAEFLRALRDLVAEQGGGVVFVAGEIHTPRLGRGATSMLTALLPVELADGCGSDELYGKPWRPILTPAGRDHPVCRLEDEEDANGETWSRLPPFYFHHAVRALRPAAVALAAVPPSEPLIVEQRVGRGVVLWVGADELWRWRASGVARHERFWAGVLRHLSSAKQEASGERAIVETDRDRYELGDPVRLSVRLTDDRRRPVAREAVEVRISPADADEDPGVGSSEATAAGSEIVRIAPVADVPGSYEGLFRPAEPGRFEARVDPSGVATFEVRSLLSESENPSPDPASLEEAAELTGGRFVRIDRLEDLPDRIPDASVSELLGRRTATVWDSVAWMLLFVALVSLEWTLRKIWRLY